MKDFFKAILVILSVGAIAVVSCYFAIPSFKNKVNEKVFKIEQEVEAEQPEKDNKSEAEYIIENETLKAEITSLKTKVEENKTIINSLNLSIKEKDNKLTKALEDRTSLANKVEDLENKIKDLEDQTVADSDEIANLEADLEITKADLANKTLEAENLALELEEVINEKNSLQITISTQEKQIANLQASIRYYEDYLKSLETEEKVYATFKVDDRVTYIQELYKGSCASHETPVLEGYQFDSWLVEGVKVDLTTYPVETNTTFVASFTKLHTVSFISEGVTVSTQTILNNECAKDVTIDNTTYKVFNGWMIDETLVNVNEIPITSDTTFIANYTYKYDVTFVVDDATTTQTVVAGSYPINIAEPSKDGYEFDGWLLNGSVVNPEEVAINQTTIFTASFTKLHTVTFVSEGTTVSTQTIRNNEYAQDVTIESTTYKVFNGWLLNGNLVNIKTTLITSDVTFTASITNKYTVNYYVDETLYHTEIVSEGSTLTAPATPSKGSAYLFLGWSLNKNTTVDLSNCSVSGDLNFYAMFEYDESQEPTTPTDPDNGGTEGGSGTGEEESGDSGSESGGGKREEDQDNENGL